MSRSCLRRVVLSLAAGLSVLLPATTMQAKPAFAASAGPLRIESASGGTLHGGGSSSVFTLGLPSGAACPADTAHHGYLLYSYVLAAPGDPGHLSFPGGYPNKGLDLITAAGEPLVTVATAIDTGAIPQLPPLDWSRYAHDSQDLPPGAYNLGVACAVNQGPVVKYWNNQVTINASATDPGGFTWTVSSTGAKAGAGGSPSELVATALVVAIVGVAGYIVLRRRRSIQSAHAPSEK